MSFELRFENKGNVHLLPRGEIVITNMWGKQRGVIPINQDSNFGNVLPDSIRLFEFTWKGEASLLDIGRYKADLTLGYGTEQKKFTTRGTAFWVIPLKPVLIFVISFLLGIWFITRTVRAYVRYMLRMSGINPDAPQTLGRTRYVLGEGDVRIERTVSVAKPVTAGIRDLCQRLSGGHEFVASFKVILGFIWSYRIFFLSVLGFIALSMVLWWYVASVTTAERDFEITIDSGNEPVVISSEEILHQRVEASVETTSTEAATTEQSFKLDIVNAGHIPGQGGVLADKLAANGYTIDGLTADLVEERSVSVIVFSPELEVEALRISEIMGGVLLSAFADATATTSTITVYLGNDY